MTPRHRQTRPPRPRRHRGFTLIELIAVLVVLAILSGVALPKYFDYRWRAQVSAAQGARASLVSAINNHRMSLVAQGHEDAFPPNLNDVLETQDGNHLLNPWHDPSMPVYNIDRGGPDKWYMRDKTIDIAVRRGWGSIWYNPDNGRCCFRVPDRGSDDATLEVFNLVNQAEATSMRQTRR
jgi:prepilin-type N-terminal cleavage/methylation domain-containing protein